VPDAKRMVDRFSGVADNNAMLTAKHATAVSPAKTGRRMRLSPKVLKFISENQQMEGFSGDITEATAMHEVDMDAVAESAARFGAQIPSPKNRPQKPSIRRFGQHPV
jgi:hypothetical protein